VPHDRGSARCRLAVSLTKLLIVRDEHGYSSARLPLYFEWHGMSPSSGPYLGELVAAAGDPGPLRRTFPFLVSFLDQPEITTQS
jgi:hypothetical protein